MILGYLRVKSVKKTPIFRVESSVFRAESTMVSEDARNSRKDVKETRNHARFPNYLIHKMGKNFRNYALTKNGSKTPSP